jgi:hypothetical protein
MIVLALLSLLLALVSGFVLMMAMSFAFAAQGSASDPIMTWVRVGLTAVPVLAFVAAVLAVMAAIGRRRRTAWAAIALFVVALADLLAVGNYVGLGI